MISVVVPLFNEEAVLPEFERRLTAAAEAWGEDFEVVAVDDGSSDNTLSLLRVITAKDARWRVIRLSRNFGHQAAVSAGLQAATGDAVVILDADLQDPPEVVERLLDRWRDGWDVVFAVRKNRKEGLSKRFAYAAFYRLWTLTSDVPPPADSGDFCVMDRKVVVAINRLPERNRFLRGLRAWAGFRQVGVEYDRDARKAGESKYTLKKLLRLASDGLFSFGATPLRLASAAGAAFCVAAFLLAAFVILWKIADVPILSMRPGNAAGWTSIVAVILFSAGVQMLLLGVIGEYLARIFDEVKGRPGWVVAEAFGGAEGGPKPAARFNGSIHRPATPKAS
jgi:glycosyltransferase involved in cell wall biosynthesis